MLALGLVSMEAARQAKASLKDLERKTVLDSCLCL